MKISIIVPVYNVRDYIIRCIDSLINQTFLDFEIIVVNDGCTDDSIELIKKNYSDSRLKIIKKKNGGVASARNFGVKYAIGDYLLFVDSDDFLEKDALLLLYQEAVKNNHDLVFCDYYKYYNETNYSHVPLIEHFDPNNLKSVITGMPGPVCRLIKRKLYLKNNIQFLENHCFEDNAIIPLLGALAKKPAYIKKPLYYYVQREESALNSLKYDKRFEDIFPSLLHLKNKFIEFKLYESCYSELEYIYIEYLLHAANLRFLDYKEGNKNIKRVALVMQEEFPNFRENKYYQKENIKYKIICNLFYYNQVFLLKLIRRIHG